MKAETIIRGLTICSLAGLLLGVGLKLTIGEVMASLRMCRLLLIIAVNFLVVPALAVAAIRIFGIGPEFSIGMILLAAAPFAPVVPVFARMARADLALAAGLTALFPLLSAFVSPFVVAVALKAVPGAGVTQFDVTEILLTLLGTITLPLAAGLMINHFAHALGQRALRPVEIISEAIGALSLAFVTFTEWPLIVATGWLPLIVMALLCEVSLAIGWAMGGPDRNARRVIGFGTSNRNIALALLMSLQSFAGTPVVSAVVANGLLIILLGLLHVAVCRFGPALSR
jgi:bile acid:Na+ symporter, BASS family